MDRKLLYKYFKGNCTAAETKEVLQWYANAKFDPDLDQEIHELFDTDVSNSVESWGKDAVFLNILDHIERGEPSSSKDKQSQKKIIHSKMNEHKRSYFKVAAVITLTLLTCGMLWFTKTNNISEDNTNQAKVSKSSYITKQTTVGQKSKMKLTDGTEVVLNAESKLWFANTFSADNERIVYLEGEAFFDVARDTTRPFVIHARNMVTRVYGTSFNVNAYSDNEAVSVAVVSGKVSVNIHKSENSEPVYLEPGEKAICNVRENTKIKKTLFSYDKEIVWKDGTLTFYKEDFESVVKKLEMWYGVKITVRKEGVRDDFTGTYHKKSLETVLEGISYVLGFDYEIKGNKVIIK